MVTDPRKAVLYYLYAHEDEALRKKLEKQLSALRRQRYIDTWCDREIRPEGNWGADIDRHLESADIILLLLSADFMASDYCYSEGVGRALERHFLGSARVIPVILRPVDWRGTAFGRLQPLPRGGRPVVWWNPVDEGLLDVARGIRTILEELRKREPPFPFSAFKASLFSVGAVGAARDTGSPGSGTGISRRVQAAHFLTLTPPALVTRYAAESLLTLDIGLPSDVWLPHGVTTEQGSVIVPQALVYENTAHLPLEAFRFQVDSRSPAYTLPRDIKGKAEHLLALHRQRNRRMFDSATIRLNRVEAGAQGVTFVVSRAHYFDYVATNYSIDARLDDWSVSLREQVHPPGRLDALDASPLANHIGLGALLFTADNFVVLPVRSRRGVNIWQGEIGPSVSGATSYSRDIHRLKKGDVAGWIAGEAAEELNLEGTHIETHGVHLLGVTRELLRGGKPEMFFFAQLNIPRSEVERRFVTAQDRAENAELLWMDIFHPGAAVTAEQLVALREDLRRLLLKYGERLSHPALANLALYYRWYEQRYTLFTGKFLA
ncbi:MAG TPA: toll/interleukin-1 receptor domain-containing protein [Ktedonobacteraceae bacterium]|jgi:hypothetical protein